MKIADLSSLDSYNQQLPLLKHWLEAHEGEELANEIIIILKHPLVATWQKITEATISQIKMEGRG